MQPNINFELRLVICEFPIKPLSKKNRLTVIRYTLKNKLIKSNRKETHK